MKLMIAQEKLLNALQAVSGVVEKRKTLPILANVLLETQEDRLIITGSDTEIELLAVVDECNIMESGRITVPGRKFLEIVRSLSANSEISLQLKDERLFISSKQSRFSLLTLPAEDFPILSTENIQLNTTLSLKELGMLIQHTQFAMAQQDVRQFLNGLLLEFSYHQLLAVASDGHRLSYAAISLSDLAINESIQVIFPRRAVLELGKILANYESADIQITKSHIIFKTHNLVFTSKLIEGRYPDFQKILKIETDKTVEAKREELKQVLQRAAILCNEKFKGIYLHLSENKLRVSASNQIHEEAHDEIEVNYVGPEIELGFNVSYILDVLNAMNAENVSLLVKDQKTSMLIEDNHEVYCKYVIMPMRV